MDILMKSKYMKLKKHIIFLCSFILFWCYIYRFQINGFPISTNRILTILGGLFLLIKIFHHNKINIKSYLLIFIFSFIVPLFFVLLTSLINNEIDFSILIGFKSATDLLAFYFYKITIKNNDKLTFNDVAFMFIFTGFVQSIISLLGFIIPDIGHFLVNIQDFPSEQLRIAAENRALNIRLIGLGAMYFGGGIIYAIDLILIGQLMTDNANFNEKCYKLLPLFYFVIFVCGMLMANTTIIGLIFSLFFLLKSRFITVFQIFKNIIIYVSIVILLISLLWNYTDKRFQNMLDYGFKLFINLYENKKIGNKSTDMMLKLYHFPELDNIKSWLIGDALFFNSNGGYYKNTDIGYCRAIYYFGLFGLFALIFSQSCILYALSKRLGKKYNFFCFVLGLMFLVLNLKGFVSINLYIIPFYFVTNKFMCKQDIGEYKCLEYL